ncbi:MAG: YbaN family protein [Chitinispirillaceae bacterium]|nr:YbaN family protein [Chitinispirillaceae bacterium]
MTIPNLKKGFFIAAGSLCLALGIIGIFVPLLPTTPFLLLAAACFFRGSDRMYNWLLNHRLFGSHIRNYRRYHAVSLKAKLWSIVALWLFIGFGMAIIVQVLWGRILLGVIAAGVTVFLVTLKTVTKEMISEE